MDVSVVEFGKPATIKFKTVNKDCFKFSSKKRIYKTVTYKGKDNRKVCFAALQSNSFLPVRRKFKKICLYAFLIYKSTKFLFVTMYFCLNKLIT